MEGEEGGGENNGSRQTDAGVPPGGGHQGQKKNDAKALPQISRLVPATLSLRGAG
jgi:hypothetical protein